MVEVFPYQSCVFSDLGCHTTVYRRAIFVLYVEHHDVFTFCASRPSACLLLDLQYVRCVLVVVFVILPLLFCPVLDERVIRLRIALGFCRFVGNV